MSEPWHCGVCGNKPCGCGDPILLVVRVPWTTTEDDAEMMARELVAMINEVRLENSNGEADPVRLMHASWAEVDRCDERPPGVPSHAVLAEEGTWCWNEERDRLREAIDRLTAEGNQLCDAVRGVTLGFMDQRLRVILDTACDQWEGR